MQLMCLRRWGCHCAPHPQHAGTVIPQNASLQLWHQSSAGHRAEGALAPCSGQGWHARLVTPACCAPLDVRPARAVMLWHGMDTRKGSLLMAPNAMDWAQHYRHGGHQYSPGLPEAVRHSITDQVWSYLCESDGLGGPLKGWRADTAQQPPMVAGYEWVACCCGCP